MKNKTKVAQLYINNVMKFEMCIRSEQFSLTRSSTRLMFAPGVLACRLMFFPWTAHGNRSAMQANLSPRKLEKMSLVWQVGDDVFPSDIQPSPFCPC